MRDEMKTILAIILAVLLGLQISSATSFLTIGITQAGTNTALTIQGNPVNMANVKEATAIAGDIDNGQLVIVIVGPGTPADELLSIFKLIKDAGLSKACVIPGVNCNSFNGLSIDIMSNTNEFIQIYDDNHNPIFDKYHAPIEPDDYEANKAFQAIGDKSPQPER